MKKNIQHSFASITSNFLKIVIHTEAHSNSTVLGYEPPAPESLTQFKKDLLRRKNDYHYFKSLN